MLSAILDFSKPKGTLPNFSSASIEYWIYTFKYNEEKEQEEEEKEAHHHKQIRNVIVGGGQ